MMPDDRVNGPPPALQPGLHRVRLLPARRDHRMISGYGMRARLDIPVRPVYHTGIFPNHITFLDMYIGKEVPGSSRTM